MTEFVLYKPNTPSTINNTLMKTEQLLLNVMETTRLFT